MRRIVIVFLSFLFLGPQGLRAATQVASGGFSKAPLTSCAPSSATTTFSTTDTAVYMFFYATGVNAGDKFIVAFYGPSGQLYTGSGAQSSFSAPSAGDGCYVTNSTPLLIAGNPAATMPGTWTAYILYNGNPLAYATFTITSSATCSYSLPTSSASVGAGSGSFSFTVTTGTGCTLSSATADVTWITPTVSGSTVNYTVQANTSTSSRVGHITVSGAGGVGAQTFTVTQAGASATCSYSLPTSSASVGEGSGSFSFTVTAGTGCTLSPATADVTWITPTISGSTVNYAVQANTSTSSRIGHITVNGQTFTVTQAAAAAAVQPTINTNGIVNAADYTVSLAPGSMTALYGQNLAPATLLASSVPLPNTLLNVWVDITDANGQASQAPLYFVSANQINFQMPFGVASPVSVQVGNAAGTSDPQTVPVRPRAPKLITRTQDGKGDPILLHSKDYSVVSAQSPAMPNEYLVLLLTGLGAVNPQVAAGRPGGDNAGLGPLNNVTSTVTVSIGGQTLATGFAGLMPGFPGVYQINFQVPPVIPPGSYDFNVAVDNVMSQDGVTATVGTNAPLAASGSVDTSGGVVTGGGLTLKVPASALADATPIAVYKDSSTTDAATGQSSPTYIVTGLPQALAAPLTVSVDLPSAPPAGSRVQAVVTVLPAGQGTGETRLDATVSGSSMTFTIPPTTGSDTGTPKASSVGAEPERASPRMTPGRGPSQLGSKAEGRMNIDISVIYIRQDDQEQTSVGGHFVMHYSLKETGDAKPQAAAAAFEEAYQRLQDYGFSWAGRTRPIDVYIHPLGAQYWGFESCDTFGDDYASLEINSTNLTTPISAEMKASIGHELFHAMQELYDPRVRYFKCKTGTWYWYLDGLSTWFEGAFLADNSYIPTTVKEANWDIFVDNGLEVGSFPREVQQQNGYGGSMFLKWLADQDSKVPVLAKVLEEQRFTPTVAPGVDIFISSPLYSVTQAMDFVIRENRVANFNGIADAWEGFGRAYMAGTVYSKVFPGPKDLVNLNGANIYMFGHPDKQGITQDPGTSWTWTAADLSFHVGSVGLKVPFPANTSLTYTLTDPGGGAEVLLYRCKRDENQECTEWEMITVFTGTYVLQKPELYQGQVLVAFVNNTAWHNGPTPITLAVSRGDDYTTVLRTTTKLIYDWGGVYDYKCPDGSDQMWGSAFGTIDLVSQKISNLVWNGLKFSAHGSDLEWPNKQRYINYSVEGTIDRLGHSMPTLVYRETWVDEDKDHFWAFAPEITVTGMQQYIPNSKNYYPPPAYYQALGPGAAAQIRFTGNVTVTTKKTGLDMTCPGSFTLTSPTDGLSVTLLK